MLIGTVPGLPATVPGVLLNREDAQATPVVHPAAHVGDSDDLAAQSAHQPREPGADVAEPVDGDAGSVEIELTASGGLRQGR